MSRQNQKLAPNESKGKQFAFIAFRVLRLGSARDAELVVARASLPAG
jgi:hypothetical protein